MPYSQPEPPYAQKPHAVAPLNLFHLNHAPP